MTMHVCRAYPCPVCYPGGTSAVPLAARWVAPPPLPVGWRCPACGAGLNPSVDRCSCVDQPPRSLRDRVVQPEPIRFNRGHRSTSEPTVSW